MRFLRLSNELIMKKLLLFPTLLLSLISTSCWSIDSNDLVKRDGLYYKKSSDIPFTGEASGGEQDALEWTREIAGEWTHSYSNGELLHKGKGKFANGEKEGEWVFLDEDGRFSSRGEFENGLKEGKWLQYDSTRLLVFEGNYKNDKKGGEWNYYHDGGQFEAKGSYKNGKREGKWVEYETDGSVNELGTGIFKNGIKVNDLIPADLPNAKLIKTPEWKPGMHGYD